MVAVAISATFRATHCLAWQGSASHTVVMDHAGLGRPLGAPVRVELVHVARTKSRPGQIPDSSLEALGADAPTVPCRIGTPDRSAMRKPLVQQISTFLAPDWGSGSGAGSGWHCGRRCTGQPQGRRRARPARRVRPGCQRRPPDAPPRRSQRPNAWSSCRSIRTRNDPPNAPWSIRCLSSGCCPAVAWLPPHGSECSVWSKGRGWGPAEG
jgi:hypothetical protein